MATKSTKTMHTENRIEIRGDVKRIFQVAAQVDKWPEILPHYRWVHILQRKKRRTTVEMAARRGRIPVRWTAVQEVFPYERITYKHIKGFTTGMDVTWSFTSVQERVQVVITHDFSLSWPVVGRVVSKYVVGALFVKPIALRTLHHIRRTVESEQTVRRRREERR